MRLLGCLETCIIMVMSNLGKIIRRHMRKERSFLCDSIIKVFSGKVSNYDDFTMSIQTIAHMLLTDD